MKKKCSGCGKTKRLEDFKKDKRCRQGRTARCKLCIAGKQRRYRKQDKTLGKRVSVLEKKVKKLQGH